MIRSMPAGLLTNLRWQYLANIAVAVLGGVYLLLLGRFLGATEFGLYSVCLSYAIIVFGFSDLRLQEATIQFVNLDDHNSQSNAGPTAEAIFSLDIVLKLLIGLVFVVAAPFISSALGLSHDGQTILFLCFLNAFVAKVGNSVAVGLLRAANRFNLHAIVLLIEWVSRVVLTALAIIGAGARLPEVLILSAVVGLVSNFTLIIVAVRAAHFRPEWLILKDRKRLVHALSSMRAFILPSYGISLLDNVAKEADVAVIALFLPLPTVGVYKMAKSIVLMMWKAADPFFLVVMPTLVKYVRSSDAAGLTMFLRRFSFLLAGVSAAMVAISAVLIPVAVPHILGPEFSDVSSIFLLMSAWILVSLPLIWTHAYAAAIGRPVLQLGGSLLGNGVMLALLFALTPAFGLIGAAIAWSTGLAACFVGALGILWAKKAFSIEAIGQGNNAR
jgi:O-antigen/teichoic acid export membrane protein